MQANKRPAYLLMSLIAILVLVISPWASFTIDQGGFHNGLSLALAQAEAPYEVFLPAVHKERLAAQPTNTPLPLPTPSRTPTPRPGPTVSPTPWPTPPPGGNSWPMAGANPERTSWTAEAVPGFLDAVWFKPIEPHILPRTQIIAAYNTLYISTANGLYALDAGSGAQKWVYATELPLGHSPTIANGVAYVGGFDRKIHAIDAYTGQGLWTFTAGAGFDTNPLVINGKLYAGNRDGKFYAVYTEGANKGQQAWSYTTGGPIHFSAAYKDGTLYFASDDSYAYALNAETGALVWKSAKLPGAGFHSYWPVVYRDVVVFAGSRNYRASIGPGPGSMPSKVELMDVYPNYQSDPRGTYVGPLGQEPGDWVPGTTTLNASLPNTTPNGKTTAITQYLEAKPWRRTMIVLNRSNGLERTYDFDNDGRPEYAPFLFVGTQSGNRFPPVVGSDGVLYAPNNYMSDPMIAGGQVTGWKINTPFLSIISDDWGAVDEPVGISAGGNLIYWNLCCDRATGAINLNAPYAMSNPGQSPQTITTNQEFQYYSYNLPSKIPGYNTMVYTLSGPPYYKPYQGLYGNSNGSYGWHGDEAPAIPYNGRIYLIRSNAIVAFGPYNGNPVGLPTAPRVNVQGPAPSITVDQLKAMLVAEVQKILAAGHLRPGFTSSGLFDFSARNLGDDLVDYFHTPGDIIYTLIQALPHLPPDLQTQARAYIQSEFNAYPPYQYNHIGWRDGAPREAFILPPEVQEDLVNYPPETTNYIFDAWNLAPQNFYAMWKYAQTFGNAASIYNSAKNKLDSPPSDSYFANNPHILNAFIAGYHGYLELERLAGYPETASVRQQFNRMMSLRASTFTKDAPAIYNQSAYYGRVMNASRNFMFLVPELADYLRTNANAKVVEAIEYHADLAPLWFVSKAEVILGEGVSTHLYDYYAIFQARALILRQPRGELLKYLDVPAFQVGDLFYIENLIRVIEAAP
jgi:hypothetical protein